MSDCSSVSNNPLELSHIATPGNDCRILTRLRPVTSYGDLDGIAVKRGVIVDVETTGLDVDADVAFEIALVPFEFDPATGAIGKVDPAVSMLEDPGMPLAANIVSLTGVTDEMLAGQKFDDVAVNAVLSTADLVIAHNASFDRPFVEKRFGDVAERCWACSLNEVRWSDHGHGCAKLECLVEHHTQCFFDGHRAANDCAAVLHLLTTPFADGVLPMHLLLKSARRSATVVRAVNAAFEMKDAMKKRGYFFHGGNSRLQKAWCCVVTPDSRDAELDWLAATVYGGQRNRWQIIEETARTRYKR